MQLLRTFLSVEAEGSFSGAARALGCVQSNVTARMRKLEEHLGGALFDRGKGGARLTALGRRLRGHAVELVARFEAAERDLLDAAGGSAPLRLGAMESTAAVRLPGLLRALKEDCPSAPLTIKTGPTGELLTDLWERRLDAAFVAGPVDADRFESVAAFEETLVVVSNGPLDPSLPLIAFRRTCSYRAMADGWLRARGWGDCELIEMGTLDGILGCVAAGVGFAVVPDCVARQSSVAAGLAVSPLDGNDARVMTHLAWRRDHVVSQVHARLCRLLRAPASREDDGAKNVLAGARP
ncbi:MAG: LysR family transcriptional regulator [Pseudomonadota bacterium]